MTETITEVEAKAILICGKICSGKTTYAKKIVKENRAVLLSCDEIMSALFGWYSENFDETQEKIIQYIFNKSLDIIKIGVDVVLDFGFWSKIKRDEAKKFYKDRGINCEIHYIDVDENIWRRNIEKRNRAVENSETNDVFVDDNLIDKCAGPFEIPDLKEIDVWYKNDWI